MLSSTTGTTPARGDNTGWPDHVGIVESVSGSTMKVIEGNMSDAVGRRTLKVNGRYIRGYGVPKFKGGSSSSAGIGSPAPALSAGGSLAFKVGDTVQFTGSTHYTSANATSGPSCKAGKAKVTAISKGQNTRTMSYTPTGSPQSMAG